MRAQLLYCLFVVFTLVIVSSEINERRQTTDEIPTCQWVDANKPNDCLLTAIEYSVKEPIWVLLTLEPTNEKLFQQIYNQKIKLSLTCQRFRQIVFIDIQALIPYLHVPLQYFSEKEDLHNLS